MLGKLCGPDLLPVVFFLDFYIPAFQSPDLSSSTGQKVLQEDSYIVFECYIGGAHVEVT